jgi:hypothetical protein
VSVPPEAMAGCPAEVNNALLSLVTLKLTFRPDSSEGPAEMLVAQPVAL